MVWLDFPRFAQMPKQRKNLLLLYSTCFLVLLLALSACNDASPPKAQSTPTGQSGSQSNVPCSAHSSNPVTLSMAYGSEKQEWITDVVADFNKQQIKACDGPITVNSTPLGSGQSMQQILDGTIQPDIWSPAGSVWLTLLNQKWQSNHSSPLIAMGSNDAPSLVNSPVVIAMWKSEAQALGWPQKSIGWADIAKLSTDPQGWKTYGHPEWGQFKFGHTHPDYSNSGLDAVIAMNYAGAQKLRGLSTDDVNNPNTQNFVRNTESAVIHYGDSTGFFATQMFDKGPGYLSATVMYESLVIEANDKTKYPKIAEPVVAIYPTEGTFYSDHPFVIPQGSWVTPAKKAAALAFRNFLLAQPQQIKAMKYGFRSSDIHLTLSAPIDSAHGVDPTQPQATLQLPNATVVQAVLDSWNQQKRKVDVMLVLDHSGSMNDPIGGTTKIAGARDGLKEFVNLMNDQDQLGLDIFSTKSEVLSTVTTLAPKRQDLLSKINGLTADGDTLLYDTINQQVQSIKAVQSTNIKAVVVLTDGQDTISKLSIDQLTSQIAATGADAGNAVKVFTIAYGDDASTDVLTKIADATGGQEYKGNPQNIKSVYDQISEFF